MTSPTLGRVVERQRKYGAVWFHDQEFGAGFAARAGERARTINSTGDLPSDVFWLTNMSYDALRAGNGIHKYRWRSDDFLRATSRKILEEFNLVPKNGIDPDPGRVVELLAEIFARTMDIARHYYDLEECPPLGNLAAGIRTKMMGYDVVSEWPRGMRAALRTACEYYVACETHPLQLKRHWVRFQRPRLTHAREVLSCLMPVGPWEWVPAHKMGPDPVRWALKRSRPVMAHAALEHLPDEYAGIVAFGSGTPADVKARRATARQFIAHPEMVWLRAIGAEVHIEDGAWLAAGYRPAAEIMRLPDFDEFPGAVTSFSMGLFAENVWVAATRPWVRGRRDDAGAGPMITPIAAWLRAADRIQSYIVAVPLIHLLRDEIGIPGVELAMYGSGSVQCLLPEMTGSQVDQVRHAARAVGLMPIAGCLRKCQTSMEAAA